MYVAKINKEMKKLNSLVIFLVKMKYFQPLVLILAACCKDY